MQLLADGRNSEISQQVTFAYIYKAIPQLLKGNTLGLMIVCKVKLWMYRKTCTMDFLTLSYYFQKTQMCPN